VCVETQLVSSILVTSSGDTVEEYVRDVIGRWHVAFGLLCLLAGCTPAASGAAVQVGGAAPSRSAEGQSPIGQALAALTPEQRVGQLFMVGLQSGASDAVAAQTDTAISARRVGNVVLYGTGWSSSAAIQAVTDRLQRLARQANAGIGLFVSGNQEGGQWGAFQAFYGVGFSPIPSPITQAEGDPRRLEDQARIWGGQLLDAGVNLNLAPVLDTVPPGTAASNDPIGRWGREYGSSPGEVTTYGVAFARGMRAARVAVAIKHFPGLGRVTGNTDFTAEGIVDDAFSGADDPYLQPYQVAIQEGAEMVMVSLAVYPRVDSRQAVFSPAIIEDILRRRLGFTGVVISDDLGAAAAVADRTPAQRALDFFRAGGDMLLTVRPSDIEPMVQAVIQETGRDASFHAKIDASVERVLRAKYALGLLPSAPTGPR
jgi:beta-N-acetylhexosaminidase